MITPFFSLICFLSEIREKLPHVDYLICADSGMNKLN